MKNVPQDKLKDYSVKTSHGYTSHSLTGNVSEKALANFEHSYFWVVESFLSLHYCY